MSRTREEWIRTNHVDAREVDEARLAWMISHACTMSSVMANGTTYYRLAPEHKWRADWRQAIDDAVGKA